MPRERESEIGTLKAIGPAGHPPDAKYDRLIAKAKTVTPAQTIVVHPCDDSSLRGPVEAAELGIITPILVGPAAKIKQVAAERGIEIGRFRIVDSPHSEAAAEQAVELIHEGKGELLMKGSLHTDELMRAVTNSKTGLRTARRISHVFIMDVPTYPETQARHHPECGRPVYSGRPRRAARRDTVSGRDRNVENSVNDRGRRAVQDGRSRADYRRRPRWATGIRQCHQSRSGKD